MNHPYKQAPTRAFWNTLRRDRVDLDMPRLLEPLIRRGDRVVSAGSCFAANLVPYLEAAGFSYIRTERFPRGFGSLGDDNYSYGKFSAAYGNIYTVRQAVQLIERALGRFRPKERYWVLGEDLVVDPFRPGLRYPAQSLQEYELLTSQHLLAVRSAFQQASVFVFTLGLTEAWTSAEDGAVFPACPGTVAGNFDATRHVFQNFSSEEVKHDLFRLIDVVREINPSLRLVLTVSPVPLVATATSANVVVANSYSKSVLRVAAEEAAQSRPGVTYFPSYEIVTGPQAPDDFFEADRRSPSNRAIATVMRAFLAQCETEYQIEPDTEILPEAAPKADAGHSAPPSQGFADPSNKGVGVAKSLSQLIVDGDCEEAAAGR